MQQSVTLYYTIIISKGVTLCQYFALPKGDNIMPSKKPVIAVRTTEDIKTKLEYIAEFNSRSAGKEIEMLIKEHIKEFEKYNGKINID